MECVLREMKMLVLQNDADSANLPVQIEFVVQVARLPPNNAVLARLRKKSFSEKFDAVHIVSVNASSRKICEMDVDRRE